MVIVPCLRERGSPCLAPQVGWSPKLGDGGQGDQGEHVVGKLNMFSRMFNLTWTRVTKAASLLPKVAWWTGERPSKSWRFICSMFMVMMVVVVVIMVDGGEVVQVMHKEMIVAVV